MISFRRFHSEVKVEHLHDVYLFLGGLARDRRKPVVRRSLARAACVLVHRLHLHTPGTAREVDAEQYLADTLDVGGRDSRLRT